MPTSRKSRSRSAAFRTRLRLHGRRRSEHRHRGRRRRRAGGRHPGHAGDGGRRHPAHPRGHRQADQVRGADALPRGARARRERLPAAAGDREPGHLRPDQGARRGRQGERDRPLSAPVPQRRDGAAGPDMAHDHLHRKDDAVAGQARSAAAAAGPRPHQGRHGRVAAAGPRAAVGRPGRVRRHAVCRRCVLPGLAADARQHRRVEAARARAGPRRRRWSAKSRSPRACTARGPSSRSCTPASRRAPTPART